MQIYVDADACPVKQIIVQLAKQYAVEVIMISDTNHRIDDGYSQVILVDQGRDSADLKLINLVHPKDLVITQDYGVAAMALGRGAYALNQNGMFYDAENMDRLLFERHLGQKVRRAGGKSGSVKKRRKEDNQIFEQQLLNFLQQHSR